MPGKTKGLFLHQCYLLHLTLAASTSHRTCCSLLLLHFIPLTQQGCETVSEVAAPLRSQKREKEEGKEKKYYMLHWHLSHPHLEFPVVSSTGKGTRS